MTNLLRKLGENRYIALREVSLGLGSLAILLSSYSGAAIALGHREWLLSVLLLMVLDQLASRAWLYVLDCKIRRR